MIPQTRVGMNVVFFPPQACVTPQSMERYAALITQIHPEVEAEEKLETVDLVTFGPQSMYFQKGVPFSMEPKPGHWSFV